MSTPDLIEAVKDAVSIHQVAQMLNLPLHPEKNGQYRTTCPVHGGKRKLAISTTYRRRDGRPGSFTCFNAPPPKNAKSQHANGDSVGLYAHIHGCNNYEAAKAIAEHYGIGPLRSTAPSPTLQKEAPAAKPHSTFDAEAYLKDLDPEHEALRDIELSPDTIREFKGGYCAKRGRHAERLALAVCDMNGAIVGFIGLALNDSQEPYMKSPFENFDMRTAIFGAERVKPGQLQVTFDPLRVLMAHEQEIENVVAVLTETDTIMFPTLEALLSLMEEKHCESIALF